MSIIGDAYPPEYSIINFIQKYNDNMSATIEKHPPSGFYILIYSYS